MVFRRLHQQLNLKDQVVVLVVAQTQERLNVLGYRDQYGRRLAEDGMFDRKTEAVKKEDL